MNSNVKLQILISTLGQRGIDSIARHLHPEVDGVEYIVLLQNPDGEEITMPEKLSRSDFRIVTSRTRGISVNRNKGIEAATAPYALLADDDVDFNSDELISVIRAFESNPDYDILTFKFHSRTSEKKYPDKASNLRKPPKGFYVTSIEIGFNVQQIKSKVRFNENFGIGTDFICGEENIFIYDALKAGLKAKFIPEYSCRHDSPSTGIRDRNKPEFIIAHGAVMRHIHPLTWVPRIMVHAWRNSRQKENIGFIKYLACAIKGAVTLRS